MSSGLFRFVSPALMWVSFHNAAFAATCSCAGAPLLTSLNTSAGEKGDLFLNYTVEVHQMNDLVSGSDEVQDETGRDRNSTSQVLSASYALTDHWSVSALISYVRHRRKIGSSFLGETRSSGIGDSIILTRYTPFFITPFSRHQLSLGLGARIPTGEEDAGNGIRLSEDMQPGIGSVGKIVWASYSYAFNQAATVQFNASANHTSNDRNDHHYAFGDELNLAVGLSQSIGTRFAYSLAVRYRDTLADRRFGFAVPNTGGKWLDFVPAIQYAISDNLNVVLSGRSPLARELNGALQFTTSYAYSLSLSYGF